MEMPTFIYSVLPSKKKEELISKRNVRVIKEFLKKREKLKTKKEDELARLKELRKGRSINASIYHRLKQVMIMTHEQKRIDLIKASIEKSVKLEKSVATCDNHPTEGYQPSKLIAEQIRKWRQPKQIQVEIEKGC